MNSLKDKYKPIIKWAGGKKQIISYLLDKIPQTINTYYEPFFGGGYLFFKLYELNIINKAIINDKNKELSISYQEVKSNVNNLIKELSLYDNQIDEKTFLRVRNIDTNKLSDTEIAARFIYLNKTCFNGLYRLNSKGKFNTPYGKPNNPIVCNSENLLHASEALQICEITNDDFENVVKSSTNNDFVYFDPPYIPISMTSNFTSYTKDSFNLNDHERLKNIVDDLTDKGVNVLISNSDSPITRHLYKDYNINEVMANRVINSIGNKRGKIKELLISNY